MHKLSFAIGAAACAATLFADPTSWFDAKISEYDAWPDYTTDFAGRWDGTSAATLKSDSLGSYLELSDPDTALVFTADESQALATAVPTMTSTILFTAYDEDDKPEIPSGAKGGLIVCEDANGLLSYWGIAKDPDAATNTWVQLVGAPSTTIETEVAITVTGSTVTYKIGSDDAQVKDIVIEGDEPTLSKASYQGVGTVYTLTGSYVEAERTLTIDATALAAENLVVTAVEGATAAGVNTYTFSPGANITVTFGPVSGSYMIGATKSQTYSAQSDSFTIATRPDAVSKAYSASEDDPLELANYTDFKAFADLVNAGDTFEGKFVKQTGTVDFSESATPWTGMGTESAYFKGTYDGDNYQLANVTFAKVTYNGVFQYFGGTIKNLVVNMIGFAGDDPADGEWGAAIVGNMRLGATFNHVITTGAISATHNLAGFAVQGHMGTYIGCTNRCAISSENRNRVAGFVSFAQNAGGEGGCISTFTDCANEADITGGTTSGTYGVTAYVALLSNGHQATFTNCVNTGTITCSNPNGFTGVFVGQMGMSGDTGSCSVTLVDCPASTVLQPVGHFVHSSSGTETFNGYFAKEVDEVLTYCATPTTKGVYQIMQANSESIVLSGVQVGDTLTLTPTLGAYNGEITCADSTFKVSDPVNNVWTVEAVPSGTTFTITSDGCTFKVNGEGEAVQMATIENKKAGDTINVTLVIDGTEIKMPVRTASVADGEDVRFASDAYVYTVTGSEDPAEIAIKVTDASESPDVKPADLVPAGTDADKVDAAQANLTTLATKGGVQDTGVMQKMASWIQAKSISGNAIAAIGTDGNLTATQFEEAYLLNVGLDATAIETAKKNFAFPSITVGSVPEIDDSNYNGTVNYYGTSDLSIDQKNWPTATTEHTFYRAELVK